MSDVWEYFQKIKNDDNVITSINCKLCETEYEASSATTTLRQHLKSVHSSTYTQNDQPKKQISPYTFSEQMHITIKLI